MDTWRLCGLWLVHVRRHLELSSMAALACKVHALSQGEFHVQEWRKPAKSSVPRPQRNLRCGPVRKVIVLRSAVENEVTNAETEQSTSEEEFNPVTVDRRREMEKFVVRDVGKFQCRSCGYVYDQSIGDPSYPIPPGVDFGQLPEDWRCSTCGAAKSFFSSISVEIAGFAENQNFGFGTNAMTSGQKSILIYGSLVLFFILFLSGYLLQ